MIWQRNDLSNSDFHDNDGGRFNRQCVFNIINNKINYLFPGWGIPKTKIIIHINEMEFKQLSNFINQQGNFMRNITTEQLNVKDTTLFQQQIIQQIDSFIGNRKNT